MANIVRNTDNTISVDELLTETISSYNEFYPVVKQFSTDFSAQAGKFNQTLISRIITKPSVQDFAGNYMTSAVNGDTLSNDVTVTLDKHRYSTVQFEYDDAITTGRNFITETSEQMAHSLGVDIMENVWDECVEANFSNRIIKDGSTTNEEHNLKMLQDIRLEMNVNKASPTGRFGIVNSTVMSALLNDEKIASGDYYGQLSGGNGIGILRNIAGFEAIYEYPQAGDNSENVLGFFGDKSAIVLAGRVPQDFNQQAALANAPAVASSTVVQDASTGFSLMGMAYQQVGTFDIFATMTYILGVHAGKAGGLAGDKTDNGGVLLQSDAV